MQDSQEAAELYAQVAQGGWHATHVPEASEKVSPGLQAVEVQVPGVRK